MPVPNNTTRHAQRSNKSRQNNRFWFTFHGLISLPVWIVFSFICLSGTIAVLSHEITWLANTNARADNPNQAVSLPLSQLAAAVETAYPSAQVTAIVVQERFLATQVMFSDTSHPYATAWVNQYTGEVQEVNDGTTFINFMRSLHGWLLFPWQQSYSIGYYLVSFMAFVTLGAMITGLIVYKKFWRSLFTFKFRTHQGIRTTASDFHKLSGVWALWFLLVMGVTGSWYFAQAVMWHTGYEYEPQPKPIEAAAVPQTKSALQTRLTLSQAISAVKQAHPNLHISYISLPEHHRDTYRIFGTKNEILYDDYSYLFTVDPWSGEIEHTYQPQTMTLVQTLAHIADPLHYGTLGKANGGRSGTLWVKLIWFFFGLLLSAMSISGFIMWHQRMFKKNRSTDSLAQAQRYA